MGHSPGMELDPDLCYRALRTRDARFDGRFFVAVRSTGIFCRPVCPARTPKREHCLFMSCAAAAQEAGYRPCLRCRPESSPGTPAWQGTSSSITRALRLIAEGALDRGSVADLAARLGLGERHLRRLFVQHLGASPLSVAKTRRVLFAKQLIDDSRMPMTQIAHAAGFSSVRRFNSEMQASYGRSPTALRKGSAGPTKGNAGLGVPLRLSFREPFDWAGLLDFLAQRAIPGVEQVDGTHYLRTFELDGQVGWVRVERVPGRNQLVAHVQGAGTGRLIGVAQRLRRLFDLDADPSEIGQLLKRDPHLRRVLRKHPGLRVPGAWDPFELAVRAVLGQQISVKGARTLAGRLVSQHGAAVGAPEGLTHLFPTPATLASADLTQAGLTGARARTINGLASAVADGSLPLEAADSLEQTVAGLCALPGIGEWTAQYIAMRALGEPDAFPAADLGLRKALAREGELPSARMLTQRAQAWRPFRAYAALLLWRSPTPATQ